MVLWLIWMRFHAVTTHSSSILLCKNHIFVRGFFERNTVVILVLFCSQQEMDVLRCEHSFIKLIFEKTVSSQDLQYFHTVLVWFGSSGRSSNDVVSSCSPWKFSRSWTKITPLLSAVSSRQIDFGGGSTTDSFRNSFFGVPVQHPTLHDESIRF